MFMTNGLDVSSDNKADDHGAEKKGMRKYTTAHSSFWFEV